jgi:hypothetical protein
LASSFTTILAVLVPTSLGMNVTVIVQLAPPAKLYGGAGAGGEIGHVFVEVKSLAFVPVIEMLEMAWGALSLLVRTVIMEALVVSWFCGPKSKLLGETLIGATVGTTPAPELK